MAERFRLASLDDYDEVLTIYQNAIGCLCSQNIDQWDELYPSPDDLLEDIRNQQLHLLVRDAEILAAVVLNESQEEEYQKGAWLSQGPGIAVVHRLCVHPDVQNKGMGRETMRRAEGYLAAKGYAAVRLDAFAQNPQAIRLYESLSYKRAGAVRFCKGEFYLFEKQLKDAASLSCHQAGKNDLKGLLLLYTQFRDAKMPDFDEKLYTLWGNILGDKNYYVIVGKINQTIISSCILLIVPNINQSHNQRPFALIENVITDESHRNKGYATQVLNFAKQIAGNHDCYKIMLLTGSKKESVLNFYRKAGYNSEDKTGFVQWL
ncbi:GCN5-related N-acetyltransferase [Syntrophobotulus glycolicus DSM 8271]|uniref:GCN5-related N-acetyltransferase n=1 Tax=Syntrophobotulus glycolicus (strain DSM 8271 / FlGlyR) TaxID=645991 RepID=F0T2H1_SYNGF|nr:GNAT family N-acetyltransferase [Syntrophobotulus glycolicus]ADY55289.1 GCN5-related N-acetyltransferase [Syntrophobotulus glycolicus DSM 8271]